MSLIDDAQAKAIEQAIHRVEAASATELVVAVVARSDDYFLVRGLVSIGWTLAMTLMTAVFVPELPPWWLVVLELPVALVLFALLGIPGLRRLLIPRAQAEAAVEQRAFAVFAARGLHRTRERTGLLILLSELEHRVVILGDSGIDAVVGEAGWKHHVDQIVRRIHEGRAADGLLEAIAELEPLLIQHAPRAADDRNELSNAVVRS